ncbi:hypothetical protein ON010_g17123 [Phytophthora cinnamomi]|nr:hypothetical protein ON010_g17123 [Phytophthora cinnamomi]
MRRKSTREERRHKREGRLKQVQPESRGRLLKIVRTPAIVKSSQTPDSLVSGLRTQDSRHQALDEDLRVATGRALSQPDLYPERPSKFQVYSNQDVNDRPRRPTRCNCVSSCRIYWRVRIAKVARLFALFSLQESVFSELVRPMVDQFFDGYNATVLAYGQTGSGKTYTMGNQFAASVAPSDRGVIPRVIENILNEEIRDLLAKSSPDTPTIAGSGLSVRGDSDRGIIVSGLSEHIVGSNDEAGNLLRSGALTRATASTSMNAQSSRSHAICTLTMEHHDVSAPEGGTETRYSKFHLVDLAGSERVRRTNSEGARFKEGVNINRGLLALGNVINALCERSRTTSVAVHVPYRDSKLTRLLQDSLGGNSKTLMIACISPADINYEETFSTLRYASRTRSIENQAVINKERSAENEVAYLKQQLEIVQLQLLQQTTMRNLLRVLNLWWRKIAR